MNAKELQALEKKLVEACEWVQENGWRLTPGGFGSERTNTCCPLGALVVKAGYAPDDANDLLLTMMPRLERGVADGFDGMPQGCFDKTELYAIGLRLRARFIGVGQ